MREFQEMNNDGCIIACFDHDYLCGYIVVSSIELNRQFPLVAAMIDSFPKIIYKGKLLVDYNAIISGPVCIDKNYRGKGILANLIENIKKFLQRKISCPELLITLISGENSRSIRAHEKAGMKVISQFKFDKSIFFILVMLL